MRMEGEAVSRTEVALRRELARLERLQKGAHEQDREALYGAVQALAWALGGNYMAPSRAFGRQVETTNV